MSSNVRITIKLSVFGKEISLSDGQKIKKHKLERRARCIRKTCRQGFFKIFRLDFQYLNDVGTNRYYYRTIVGGAFLLYAKNYLDTSVDDFDALIEDKSMTTRSVI